MDDIMLSAAQWRSLCRRIIASWGAPDDIAACVGDSLVDAELAGVPSHGIVRIPSYHDYVKEGSYRPAARPEVVHDAGVAVVVDGHWGFGQPAVRLALEAGMARARAQGMAGVSVVNAGHVGRLGEYVEHAAAAGMIGLMCTSSGGRDGVVAPYGGMERVFSTNPMAAGVPAGSHPPFVMDFATTVVAAGKVEMAVDQEMPIPEGVGLDKKGTPATVAREVMQGGSMLPFGAHKGYALMLLVELLGGALTGAGVPGRPEGVHPVQPGSNASFLVLIDIEHFTGLEAFYSDVDGLLERLKKVRPATGFQEVLIPGELEARARARNEAAGITLDGVIWEQVGSVAAEHNLNLDALLA